MKLRASKPRGFKGDEARLQSAFVDAMKLVPSCKLIRVNSGATRVRGGWMHGAPAGTPDFLVMLPKGQSLWIELKAPGGMLNEAQMVWHEQAAKLEHAMVVGTNVGAIVALIRKAIEATAAMRPQEMIEVLAAECTK